MADVVATLRLVLDEADQTEQFTAALQGSLGALDALTGKLDPLGNALEGVVTNTELWTLLLDEALGSTNKLLRDMQAIQGIDPGIRPDIRETQAVAQQGGSRGAAAIEDLERQLREAQGQSFSAIQTADAEGIITAQRKVLELQEAINGAKKATEITEERTVDLLREQAKIQLNIAKADTNLSPTAKRELVALEQQLVALAEDKTNSEKLASEYSEIIVKVKRFNLQEEKEIQKALDDQVANLIKISKLRNEGGRVGMPQLRDELGFQNQVFADADNDTDRSAALDNIIKLRTRILAIEREEKAQLDAIAAAEKQVSDLLIARAQLEGTDRKESTNALLAREKEYIALLDKGTLSRKEELQVTKDLIRIQRALTEERKRSDTGGNPELEAAQQERRALQVSARNVKLQPGGPKGQLATEALDTLEEAYQRINRELQSLDDTTDVYIEKQKTLGEVTAAINSKEAGFVGKQVEGRASINKEIERAIRLSRTQTEAGERARSFLREQGGIITAQIDAQEAKLLEVRNRINEIAEGDAERIKLIAQENQLIEKQTQNAENLARVEAASRPRGTGRRALAARRRASGNDTYGALLDASRIAQDAPFGVIGIANNLGPAADSFSRLYDQIKETNDGAGALGKTFKALGKDLIFTPVGWIVLLNTFTSLLIAMPKIKAFFAGIGGDLDLADRKAEELSEKLATLRNEIAKEGIELLTTDEAEVAVERLTDRVVEFENAAREARGFQDNAIARTAFALESKILGFFGLLSDVQEENRQNVEVLEEQYLSLAELVQRETGITQGYTDAILNGTAVAIERNIKRTQIEIQRQYLETQQASARTMDERLSYAKQLFELETEIQRDQIRIQLKQEQEKLDVLSRAYVNALVFRTLTAEQLSATRGIAVEQAAAVQGLLDLLDDLDGFRAGALENQLDGIRDKGKDTAEDIAKATRSALRSIQDLQSEIIGLQIENNNRSFELRRQQLEEEGRLQAQAAARAKQDFAETVKELAARHSLIARFNSEQDKLLREQAEARRIEREEIAHEEAVFFEQQDRLIADARNNLEALDQRFNTFISEDQVELSQQALSHRLEILAIEREISDIRSKDPDEITDADNQIVQILQEQIFYLEEIQGKERDRLELTQRITNENNTQARQIEFLLSQYEVAAANAVRGDNSYEDAARSARVNLERELEILKFQDEEAKRNAELILNTQEREDEIQRIEAESSYQRYLIWKEYFDKVKDLEYQFFDDRVYEAYQFGLDQIGIIKQTADTMYQTWEQNFRAQLELQGITGEEQTEMVETEGKKRLKIVRAIAKLQIVASTALAAVEAYEGALKTFSFLGPGAHAIAAVSAGIAIAYGKSQYDAVDRATIGGGGSAGSAQSFGISESLVPGLQGGANPLLGDVTQRGGVIITGSSSRDAGLVGAISGVRQEVNALREEMGGHADRIASRPAEIAYRADTAADLVRVGVEHEASRSR